jgi:hypothetical protein
LDPLFQSKKESSGDWSRAQGAVHGTSVRLLTRNIYLAEISYSYPAGGEYYSGHFLRFFFSEKAADSFVAPFPQGRKIVVRYRPNSPAVSTLFAEDMEKQIRRESY